MFKLSNFFNIDFLIKKFIIRLISVQVMLEMKGVDLFPRFGILLLSIVSNYNMMQFFGLYSFLFEPMSFFHSHSPSV